MLLSEQLLIEDFLNDYVSYLNQHGTKDWRSLNR